MLQKTGKVYESARTRGALNGGRTEDTQAREERREIH